MATALEGVEGLLLDLSGVIYVQDEAVPGAADALERLRSEGIPIRLVTNTTMRPRSSILERLDRLGIEADPAELITPATLAKRAAATRRATSRSPWSSSTSFARTWRASRSGATRSTR